MLFVSKILIRLPGFNFTGSSGMRRMRSTGLPHDGSLMLPQRLRRSPRSSELRSKCLYREWLNLQSMVKRYDWSRSLSRRRTLSFSLSCEIQPARLRLTELRDSCTQHFRIKARTSPGSSGWTSIDWKTLPVPIPLMQPALCLHRRTA